MTNYELKDKMRLYVPSIQGHVTPANLTDALAVEALAENPGRLSCFRRYPDTWKKDVEAFKKPATKKAEAETSEDAPAKSTSKKS